MPAMPLCLPDLAEQQILDRVEVLLPGSDPEDRARYADLMCRHHYLKSDTLVGEQLRYVAAVDGQWVALLSWSAAAQHLRDREQWIGWSHHQRRRRLALVANNARFLILPEVKCSNLASRVLALCTSRLSSDWLCRPTPTRSLSWKVSWTASCSGALATKPKVGNCSGKPRASSAGKLPVTC